MASVTETMKAIRYLLEKYGNVEPTGASPSIEKDRPRHFPISKATRREILVLRENGMTVANIAITIGRSITTVRNVLKMHAARLQARRVACAVAQSPHTAPQSPRKL